MPGSGAGVAVGEGVAGCVGVSGIWRKPAPIPPTFLQTHLFLIPSGKCHLSHLTLSSVPREGSMSPASPCQDRTKWGKGSSLAPQQSGSGQPPLADVATGLQQILSLFSFLLHEMGIINEKQRGTGGEVEGQSCLPVRPAPPPRAGTLYHSGLD